MVVLMLQKTFTAGKTYATRERSAKLRLPKGVIWQIASKGQNGITDHVIWWLEINGSPFFPRQHTEDHWGLYSKPSLGHIDDRFPITDIDSRIELVGYNASGGTDYWLQVFVTVIPEG